MHVSHALRGSSSHITAPSDEPNERGNKRDMSDAGRISEEMCM